MRSTATPTATTCALSRFVSTKPQLLGRRPAHAAGLSEPKTPPILRNNDTNARRGTGGGKMNSQMQAWHRLPFGLKTAGPSCLTRPGKATKNRADPDRRRCPSRLSGRRSARRRQTLQQPAAQPFPHPLRHLGRRHQCAWHCLPGRQLRQSRLDPGRSLAQHARRRHLPCRPGRHRLSGCPLAVHALTLGWLIRNQPALTARQSPLRDLLQSQPRFQRH
jgi:hypothetical protein